MQIIAIIHLFAYFLNFAGNNLFFKNINSLLNERQKAVENIAINPIITALIINHIIPVAFKFIVAKYDIKNVNMDITP